MNIEEQTNARNVVIPLALQKVFLGDVNIKDDCLSIAF